MNEPLRSILIGTSGLTLAAAAALVLTVARGGIEAEPAALRRAVRTTVLAILVQAIHFAEELSTAFHQRLPEVFGLQPWPLAFFLSFNAGWLVIWGWSAWGLWRRRRIAMFPLWFLGIASVANGIAHPALALRTGGYFPGLITSLFLGIAGVLLLRQLGSVTRPTRGPAIS